MNHSKSVNDLQLFLGNPCHTKNISEKEIWDCLVPLLKNLDYTVRPQLDSLDLDTAHTGKSSLQVCLRESQNALAKLQQRLTQVRLEPKHLPDKIVAKIFVPLQEIDISNFQLTGNLVDVLQTLVADRCVVYQITLLKTTGLKNYTCQLPPSPAISQSTGPNYFYLQIPTLQTKDNQEILTSQIVRLSFPSHDPCNLTQTAQLSSELLQIQITFQSDVQESDHTTPYGIVPLLNYVCNGLFPPVCYLKHLSITL